MRRSEWSTCEHDEEVDHETAHSGQARRPDKLDLQASRLCGGVEGDRSPVSTLQIQTPRVLLPMLRPSRYKGLYGGRGGMKSHFFAELLIERCLMRETRAVCIREVQRSLEQSVKRLLEDKIKAFGVGHQFRIMDAVIETPYGGVIIFNGMQNHTAESIKSLEGYDIAWVEEAQSLSERSLTLLRPTIRKPDSEIWFSWNPRFPDDPVDNMLRGNGKRKDNEKWECPPNTILIKVNYPDNPWFPDVLRQEMEWDQRTDHEKYEHVWEGDYEKHSEARVFKNWRVEEFTLPPNVSYYVGSDWGFSIDPSTMVRVHESRKDWVTDRPWPRKRLYIDADIFQIGVEIDHLPMFFDGLVCGCTWPRTGPCRNSQQHGWARNWAVIADSARPETISYLRRNGYGRMEAAKKGANSVKEGVLFLQGYDIIIHPRCKHTIDEFRSYSYERDKITDKITPVLQDKKNHIIDPVRYAVEQLRGTLQIREALWG